MKACLSSLRKAGWEVGGTDPENPRISVGVERSRVAPYAEQVRIAILRSSKRWIVRQDAPEQVWLCVAAARLHVRRLAQWRNANRRSVVTP